MSNFKTIWQKQFSSWYVVWDIQRDGQHGPHIWCSLSFTSQRTYEMGCHRKRLKWKKYCKVTHYV